MTDSSPALDEALVRLRRIERRDDDARRRSAAANFIGVLAAGMGEGPYASGYAPQLARAFAAAIRLDPTNDEAKFNLELVLARATKPKRSSGGGAGSRRSHEETEGAGSTNAGAGY